jgi:hypothetical protein
MRMFDLNYFIIWKLYIEYFKNFENFCEFENFKN